MSQLLTQQKEHRRKKRNKWLLKWGLALFLLLVIFGSLVFISRQPQFLIKTVELSGQTLVNSDEVVSASQNFLSGHYLGLFPRNNIIIYPKNSLQKFLKEKFKRIDTIQIKLIDFKKLEIIITEKKQQSLWCDGSPDGLPAPVASGTPETLSEKCYFLDDNGFIFSEAPNFSGDAYFKYYGNVSADAPIGQIYLSSSKTFQEMSDFVERVEQTTVTPVSVSAGDGGDFTMWLVGGGKIYFNYSESLSKTADNLKALLQTILSSNPTAISKIDYIDLRFGDKLYYKMK